MFTMKKKLRVAADFDGESPRLGDAATAQTPEFEAYRNTLQLLRQGAQLRSNVPEIGDAQFGEFMRGIHDGIAAPAPRLRGLWAMASLAAAALVLVVSLLTLFSSGADPVRATEVESVSTELEGVTVDFYDANDGMSTVWVTMPESDLW